MTDYKQIRKERTRESIKEAALEIARQEGWDGVTIRKISDKIHYTPPIVYEHFKNKDDLYHHLVQDGFQIMFQSIESEISGVTDPEERLTRFALARFDFAVEHPVLHHVMFDSANPQWQKLELTKFLNYMKTLLMELMDNISGDSSKSLEYSLNLICLIKGYTFFTNHIKNLDHPKDNPLAAMGNSGRELFVGAIGRFIKCIKQKP